ncbi:hypothetical protein [Falsirhodobacter sp. 20TX0035]|uniref:hypothetical protein n=1 Tax=Falsirhodobacter sp. 20TX0035 TaxID=3022019 RepID=UPI00232FF7AE|nr:hypothetical protein [Falsirhodobacter sp. 20TX0035]MDB6453374.1 hypothetical protein [Falsirhodobacter sp. 20TX0035]
MLTERDVSFFHVIDPPALLLDSIILTCTLRQHLPGAEVIAYCPETKRDLVPGYIRDFYQHMDVDLRFMPAGEFQPYYKQGNKIVAACQPRSAKHSVFLDTDIAIGRPFDINLLAKAGHVGVVPEGKFTWGKDQTWWNRVYEKFDMPLPEERIRLSRVALPSLPYFNAGMVSFPTDSSFAAEWMAVALALDAYEDIPQRRPWQDQIALPLAIQRSGLAADVLGPIFNLSLTRNLNKPQEVEQEIRRVDRADGIILHFHQPHYLNDTRYAGDVDAALRRFTSWDSVDAMMEGPRERSARAGHVFHQFHTLKNNKQRTPEENELFNKYRTEKDAINVARHNMDIWLKSQPDSILR